MALYGANTIGWVVPSSPSLLPSLPPCSSDVLTYIGETSIRHGKKIVGRERGGGAIRRKEVPMPKKKNLFPNARTQIKELDFRRDAP